MIPAHSNLRRIISRVHSRGIKDVLQRVARRMATWLARKFRTSELDFPLLVEDVADSSRLSLFPAPARTSGPLRIAWICTPPAPGSGGHTTLFRMVEGMERRGHRCTILLYNRHGVELNYSAGVIRKNWPDMAARILHAPSRIEGFDACVASSWETAHVLVARGNPSQHRFYFVQDFEPYFYPRGGLYALAEDSYRFGFHHIAVGNMVHEILRQEVGVESSIVPFGCDTGIYKLENFGERTGVVFFSRPAVDRRGFLLAKLALTEFHRRHPEQPITAFGDIVHNWDVPHHFAGRLAPRDLNALYNRSAAGLVMSFTNVSLVPEEMLASGMRPVVNDSPLARMGLPNENVIWAPATPGALADALSMAIENPVKDEQLRMMAGSVRQGWETAQLAVAQEIESACSWSLSNR